jgi:hypothetical protein
MKKKVLKIGEKESFKDKYSQSKRIIKFDIFIKGIKFYI